MQKRLYLLIQFTNGCLITALTSLPNIRIRRGKPSDELPIAFTMAKELMNPLGISHHNNLLVACDVVNSRELIGWAQIRSIGYAGPSFDSTQFEDGSQSNFRSRSRFSLEQEVDDMIWEEFEDDPTPIPTGLASLPWTDEYKQASLAADSRQARRNELKIELENEVPKLWELSSVYVIPKYRKQGIGSELVKQVLIRQDANHKPSKDVYALTLAKNVGWYEQFGFQVEANPPGSMSFEIAAGSMITKLIGEELICIRTRLPSLNSSAFI